MSPPATRILLIEDEPSLVLTLTDRLTSEGYVVESAEDGPTGLARAAQGPFDLIILGVMLPGMNGFEATTAIHAHRCGRGIPVVAVSSYCVDHGHWSGAFKDFIACVGKPWEEEALLQIVTEVLYGRTVKIMRAA